MSTPCFIAMHCTDGMIRGVYCHWDGYLDGVGRTLVQHYPTLRKAGELLLLGDLSALDETPFPGSTVAYHRDMKQPLILPREWRNPDDLLNDDVSERLWIDYIYLLGDDGMWRYTEKRGGWFLLPSLAEFDKRRKKKIFNLNEKD